MIKTQELIFPTLTTDDPYSKDAKCLSDIIENFQKENEKKIEVIDIKYCFNIISKVEMNVLDPSRSKAYEIPISTALILYKDVE